jgi:hypothetical protein
MKFTSKEILTEVLKRILVKLDAKFDQKVTSVTSGTPDYITVDSTDPMNPVINMSAAFIAKIDKIETLWEEVFEADRLITFANISVPAPVLGETPVSTIAETAEYTASISWNPNDNPFKQGTVYTATISVAPKEGFKLEGLPANFFTVPGATSVTNNANSGVITAIFPKTSTLPNEATPSASINYVENAFVGLNPNAEYLINNISHTADAAGKVAIDPSWYGTDVSVVAKAVDPAANNDSSAQTVSVPAIPAAPVVSSSDAGGDLVGTDTTMEYSNDGGTTWNDASASPMTGLASGNYKVRYKADGDSFASEAASVFVNLPRESTPELSIDYENRNLTNLVPNESYAINGATVTADASGNVAIDPALFGTEVSIVKKAVSVTTSRDSTAQTLSIPALPVMPTITTSSEGGDLIGVDNTMQYKLSSNPNWTDISGTKVDGLAAGTYEIRIKSTGTSFASDPVSVAVSAAAIPKLPTPSAGINYATKRINNLVANEPYTVNGTSETADANGQLPIKSTYYGMDLSIIRISSDSAVENSDPQLLYIPTIPVMPALSTTPQGGDIIGVTTDMEYQGEDGVWRPVTESPMTGLASMWYLVRIKATDSSFESAISTIQVTAPIGPIDSSTWELTYEIPATDENVIMVDKQIPVADFIGYNNQVIPIDAMWSEDPSNWVIKLYSDHVPYGTWEEVQYDFLGQAPGGPNKLTMWGFWDENTIYLTGNNATGSPVKLKLVKEA